MPEQINPFDRLYVPSMYDNARLRRKVETCGGQQIVTDFTANKGQIVAQDLVSNGRLYMRTLYDATTQQRQEVHLPTHSHYCLYDRNGKISRLVTQYRTRDNEEDNEVTVLRSRLYQDGRISVEADYIALDPENSWPDNKRMPDGLHTFVSESRDLVLQDFYRMGRPIAIPSEPDLAHVVNIYNKDKAILAPKSLHFKTKPLLQPS